METFAGATLVFGENLRFCSFVFRSGELVSFLFRVRVGQFNFFGFFIIV